MIYKIKEGGYLHTGLNILVNDKHAYINLTLKLPLLYRKRLKKYYNFSEDITYINVVMAYSCLLGIRVRTWAFVSIDETMSFLSKVKSMFLFRAKIVFNMVGFESSQSMEMFYAKYAGNT